MKVNLEKTYFYKGRQYGPGEDVEVPDEIAEMVKGKRSRSEGTKEASKGKKSGK